MTDPILGEHEVLEAHELRKSGASYQEIAEGYGVSEGCVRASLKRYGMPVIDTRSMRAKLLGHQIKDAYRMYKQGAFLWRVASAYNVSTGHLHKYFRDAGLPSLGRRAKTRN